jgi:hypothetical protein
VPLSSPGTYQLSYLVMTHDALLVGSPPTLVLQLADPRYVERVCLMRLCRAFTWCFAAKRLVTAPPYLCLCTSYPNVTCTVVNVTAGSPLLSDMYDTFVIDTDPPVVTLAGVVNVSVERKSVCWMLGSVGDVLPCTLTKGYKWFTMRVCPSLFDPRVIHGHPPPHCPGTMALLVHCGNEAHAGCHINASVSAASPSQPTTSPVVTFVNATAGTMSFTYPTSAVVVVEVWAVDAVGNQGQAVLVDTLAPVTVWPPLAPTVNQSSLLLAFNCTKTIGCSFKYALGDAALKPLGNTSTGTSGGSTSVANTVDTVLVAGPPRVTRSTSAAFVFDARVAGVTPQGGASVDVRVDGATLWTPVGASNTLTLSGLAEGVHMVEARARHVQRALGL